MAILLNHTIVPAKDKNAAAAFFARIMGLEVQPSMGHFAPVRVNDTLTFDFDNADGCEGHHYAFQVSDEEFEAIYGRIKAESVPHGSGPRSHTDGQINHRSNGRGVYFEARDGHLLELMTTDQSR
jgi:catechol 2,3-dioxygenase-like lactoylglutathione lyase family enzyme